MVKARSKCGVFGIWENFDEEIDEFGAYTSSYLIRRRCSSIQDMLSPYTNIEDVLKGLKSLQHRGRESCGIAYINDKSETRSKIRSPSNNDIIVVKKHGLVSGLMEAMSSPLNLNTPIPSQWIYSYGVIGHVRYSTSGSKDSTDVIQPLQASDGSFALAHNGNIPNIETLKSRLGKDISLKFISSSVKNMNDTGLLCLILELMGIEDGIRYILDHIPGAYSLIILTKEAMYLVRDPYGFKPLCLAKIDSLSHSDISVDLRPEDCKWYASSENSAIRNIFASFGDTVETRDVPPGTAYRIDKSGLREIYHKEVERKSLCSFEFVYFMYYKTTSDTLYVDDIRNELGRQMVLNDLNTYPENTIVIGSPNSGISYAKAYSKNSKIRYNLKALQKQHKERTFILPTNGERISKIKKIMIADRSLIEGNEVILIDDSIVRGNTIKHVIQLLRDNGATRVHVKIALPKIVSPCYYGIDFPTYEELIGSSNTEEDICKIIEADTLQYTSVKTLQEVLKNDVGDVCVSCLTDKHELSKYDW